MKNAPNIVAPLNRWNRTEPPPVELPSSKPNRAQIVSALSMPTGACQVKIRWRSSQIPPARKARLTISQPTPAMGPASSVFDIIRSSKSMPAFCRNRSSGVAAVTPSKLAGKKSAVRASTIPGTSPTPRGSVQELICKGNDTSKTTYPTIAGLKGLYPSPPNTCLPSRTETPIPTATNHQGA